MTNGQRFSRACSALMRERYFPGSESDSPYEAFCIPYPLEGFRAMAKVALWWKIDERTTKDWFAAIRDNLQEDERTSYELLERLLTGGRHFVVTAAPRAGRFHKTRHYLVREIDGELAGLLVLSVET